MRTSPLHPALHAALFLAGLAAVAWVGAGYLAFHPAGVAVLLVIAACYIAGAIELYRYRQATDGLAQALARLPEPAPPGSSTGTGRKARRSSGAFCSLNALEDGSQ